MTPVQRPSRNDPSALRVGVFPYNPGYNPYQQLFADAVEDAGATVVRIGPRKILPLDHALSYGTDILHLDWPHDLYLGRNPALQFLKRGMYGWGLHRLRGRPLVWTAHNLVGHDSADAAYEHQMIQRLIDRCDGIVSFSHAAKAALRHDYRIPATAEVAVIPHGHYVDAYPNTVTPAQARSTLGLPSDAIVVLGFGTFAAYKGYDLLIDAFRKIGRRDAVLLLAGPAKDPALVARLTAMAAECRENDIDVRLMADTIAAEEVQNYFNACDLVCLPFRSILNSGSLMLAMSFARCVVAPSMGSVSEVAYPDALFDYAPDNPDGLRESLARAMETTNLADRGRDAMRYALESCGWDKTAAGTLGLYERILGRAR